MSAHPQYLTGLIKYKASQLVQEPPLSTVVLGCYQLLLRLSRTRRMKSAAHSLNEILKCFRNPTS